jgi:hypothetical protein
MSNRRSSARGMRDCLNSPYKRLADPWWICTNLMCFRLVLHKPDPGDSYISGAGLLVRLSKAFCIEPVGSQALQVMGTEAAGRPENSQRQVFSLILISILAGSQALARLLQVYQYDNQDSPPVFSLSSSNQSTAVEYLPPEVAPHRLKAWPSWRI